MMPILLVISIAATYAFKKIEDKSDRKFAVVDRTPGEKVYAVLETALERRNREDTVDKKTGERTSPSFSLEKIEPADWGDPSAVDEQRMKLSERVQRGDLTGFIEVGPEAFKPTDVL